MVRRAHRLVKSGSHLSQKLLELPSVLLEDTWVRALPHAARGGFLDARRSAMGAAAFGSAALPYLKTLHRAAIFAARGAFASRRGPLSVARQHTPLRGRWAGENVARQYVKKNISRAARGAASPVFLCGGRSSTRATGTGSGAFEKNRASLPLLCFMGLLRGICTLCTSFLRTSRPGPPN